MDHKPTALVLFGGGGLASIGLMDAGFDCVAAVEINTDHKHGKPDVIAQYYSKNLPGEVVVAPVQDVDYRRFKGVDLVQSSPPCINASIAKTDGKECELDKELA